MNKTLRITLACFLGATLGAVFALHFNRYFWWLGILIGAVTGYLAYDFKEVGRVVVTAFQHSCAEASDLIPSRWVVKKSFQLLGIVITFAVAFIMATVLIGITWMIPLKLFGTLESPLLQSWSGLGIASFIAGLVSLLAGVLAAVSLRESEVDLRRFLVVVFLVMNPFGITWMLFAQSVSFGRRIPDRIASRFIMRVFLTIHSDIRLLCMADAALGALIGYTCGNPLIGGIAGAALGVLNYWIVSIRWLKLTPVH